MNNDNHLSGWPLVISWLANGTLWIFGGMSPLQAIALVITIGYTLHRWYLLRKFRDDDGPRNP